MARCRMKSVSCFIAAIMTAGMQEIDHDGAESQLVSLLGEQKVKRVPLGDDALWIKA